MANNNREKIEKLLPPHLLEIFRTMVGEKDTKMPPEAPTEAEGKPKGAELTAGIFPRETPITTPAGKPVGGLMPAKIPPVGALPDMKLPDKIFSKMSRMLPVRREREAIEEQATKKIEAERKAAQPPEIPPATRVLERRLRGRVDLVTMMPFGLFKKRRIPTE